MTRVVVLGATGMLGAAVADVLAQTRGIHVTATAREDPRHWEQRHPWYKWEYFDAEEYHPQELARLIAATDWVVNAIGVIKPRIHPSDTSTVERAIRVNAIFPHSLARIAEQQGCRVIQIATDCVFQGRHGGYLETDRQDATDIYGKTKSLGEVISPAVFHLRCSIVGLELRSHVSLLDWFRFQPKGAQVDGFIDHMWNGITTLAYGRICRTIISSAPPRNNLQHLVPADAVSKNELLRLFSRSFQRSDITIAPKPAPESIDRTLATLDEEENARLWSGSGYPSIPAIARLIEELGDFRSRVFGGLE